LTGIVVSGSIGTFNQEHPNQKPTMPKIPTALVFRDKKSKAIIHIIVCENEQDTSRFIMKDDLKLDYQIIPNWDSVCEAVNYYKKTK
jgi:hypothetical protein